MTFLEDYTLLEELGQGGFATVYKVRNNRLGYIRAVRVLNATIAHGEEDMLYQKFLNECRLLLCLGNGNHPNIVHIYRPRLKDNKALVEMDYIDGQDVAGFLRSNSGFVQTDEVINLLKDMSSALAYCHEDIYKYCMDRELDNLEDDPADGSKVLIDEQTRKRLIEKYKVIHNDLHSGNIMRRENGTYILLDFGLAIEGDDVVRSSRRTNGAPEFKAPEKWQDDGIITTQTDIYSFGVILYEYLTGHVPFQLDKTLGSMERAIFFVGEAHQAIMPEPVFESRKEAFENAHPGSKYEKDYPDWLENVIMKCLEKDPKDRYANAKELYEEVKKHLKEVPESAKVGKEDEGENVIEAIEIADQSDFLDEIERLNEENRKLTAANSALEGELAGLKNNQKNGVSGKWIALSVFLTALIAAGIGYFLHSL